MAVFYNTFQYSLNALQIQFWCLWAVSGRVCSDFGQDVFYSYYILAEISLLAEIKITWNYLLYKYSVRCTPGHR